MIIFCCSANHSLLGRWQKALEGAHLVYQATVLDDINALLKQQISPELMILHASLVDPENCRRLRAALPSCRLFVLSDRPLDEEGIRYLGAGAVGYGNSYITPARLGEAVQAIAGGSVWVGQTLLDRLLSATARQPVQTGEKENRNQSGEPLQQLSTREYQIARLIGEGLSNGEISARLGITERTVKAHLSSIYKKTGTRGRLNLALAIRNSGR